MIKFNANSITVDNQTYTLEQLKEGMLKAKIKEDDLVLVDISITDRECDNRRFVLRSEDLEFVRNLAKQCTQCVFGSTDEFVCSVRESPQLIFNFLKDKTKGYDSKYILVFCREYFQAANPDYTLEKQYLVNSRLLEIIEYLDKFKQF